MTGICLIRSVSLSCAEQISLALWMQTDGFVSGNTKSPMEYIHEAPPIKVHGSVVASFGGALVSVLSCITMTHSAHAASRKGGQLNLSDYAAVCCRG